MQLKPAQLLLNYSALLTNDPLPGPILDLACGKGHNGIYLALKNLSVVCCDKSQEAMDHVRKLADEQGVSVSIWPVDLEQKGINPFHENFYGAILVFRYLHRPLIPCIRKTLKRGGILIYETFTIEQPRFGKPHNPHFLLRPKELYEWFKDWKIIHYFEGILLNPKRAVAQIVCQKPPELDQK